MRDYNTSSTTGNKGAGGPVTPDASGSEDDDWLTAKDNEHLAALGSLPEEPGRVLTLAGASVAHLMIPLARNRIPGDALFANAVAGVACFGFAHRLLRSGLLLLHFGYYESVAPLLRSAYEAAECGQYLSKDPEAAERWINGNNWPRREVRHRLGDRTRGEIYGRWYGLTSSLSHPTPRAVGDSALLADGQLRAMLFREVDSEKLRSTGLALASTAVFACFALRNAGPDDSLEPRWLKGLAELAQAVSEAAGADYDWSHLERQWDASQARWEKIANHLRPNDEIERALDEHA